MKTSKKLTLKTTTHIIISLLAAYKRQKQFVLIARGAIKTNTSVDANNLPNMDILKIINTATNAIPTFSGRDDEARAMLAALEMLEESVDEQHHRIIVQAVESNRIG